jgi:hypothetical protein
MADFAVVQGPEAGVTAWLQSCGAPQISQQGGIGLAVWGQALASPDGRVLGGFAGVLLSDHQVVERLAQRGLQVSPANHAELAVVDAALHGPAALNHWRWQGSLACLHLGQRTALVARDPLGVGWLGRGLERDVQILSNRLALSSQWPAVPPGMALQVGAVGSQARALDPQGEARFFLREKPDFAEPAVLGRQLRERLTAAMQACVRGCGRVDLLGSTEGDSPAVGQMIGELLHQSADLPLAGGTFSSPAAWTLQGAAHLLGEVEAPAPTAARLEVGLAEPFEPVERCDPADRPERWWRARALDAALHGDRHAAAARGQTLVALHLDAAVLAWLGAMPRSQRPLLAGRSGAP